MAEPTQTFKPYVSADRTVDEVTVRALLIGAVLSTRRCRVCWRTSTRSSSGSSR
jgi:hypothetical protein